MARSRDAETELSFEQALEQLEQLVARLEGGELSLEDSLETFERGIVLVRLCSARLESAELRVTRLEQGRDGPTESPLKGEEEE